MAGGADTLSAGQRAYEPETRQQPAALPADDDEFDLYGDAFYQSAVNFAQLGYGDVVMSARHRLLGPLEAIDGALMIGVSTATLMVAFQDSLRRSALPGEALRTPQAALRRCAAKGKQ